MRDRPAIACGPHHWTYGEFDAVVERVAAGLQGHGVAKGDRVAVLARNSHAFAALRFGLARLGAVLVPINFMLTAEEVAFVLRHAGARMLAVDASLAELGRTAAALNTKVERFIALPGENGPEPVLDGLSFARLMNTTEPVPTGRRFELATSHRSCTPVAPSHCPRERCSRTKP